MENMTKCVILLQFYISLLQKHKKHKNIRKKYVGKDYFYFIFFFLVSSDFLFLISWVTQDNHNKTKQQKNKGIWLRSQHLGLAWSQHQAGKPLGVNTCGRLGVSIRPKKDQTVIFFIHQNINYLLKEYNRLLIKDY